MAKENENNEINKTSVMPNNLEAEQALLGCLLIDIDTQTDILDKLTEEDFYQESLELSDLILDINHALTESQDASFRFLTRLH